MDEKYYCKIKHVNNTEPISLEVAKVYVKCKCYIVAGLFVILFC